LVGLSFNSRRRQLGPDGWRRARNAAALLILFCAMAGCRSESTARITATTRSAGQPTTGTPITVSAAHSESLGGAVLAREFIFQTAPFRSAHASTIADTPHGLVAAWFGGSDEGNADVGIWVARQSPAGWEPPTLVAEGLDPSSPIRYPCWNPVLIQIPLGPLVLFYKVGPNPAEWWGMRLESRTYGRTWSDPTRLPEGILGPVKNKPILSSDGALLCGSSTEDHGWRIHFERTPDGGRHWSRTPPLNDPQRCGLIQPTLLAWPNGRVQSLSRSQQGAIYESWMTDSFEIWTPPTATGLPNPNSGIDAVMLEDGRGLLVYNHTDQGRSPLNVATSRDGRTWSTALVLESEPGEFSYPAVIQAADGLVHLTYTWNRVRIRHVVLDPRAL